MKIKQKNNMIGVKELRANLDTYINRVHKGETLTVFRRSNPVFKISPVVDEEDMWETVVDFTKIKKGGVALVEAQKVLTRLLHG